MLISVVVPHLNQETYLITNLESLNEQVGYSGEYEVIVVDNGSTVPPVEVCDRWPNVRLLCEPTPGPGPARNRGVKEARGDVLAFIDADCVAHPSWLSAIEAALQDGASKVIGGDVRVSFKNATKPLFHEPFEAIYMYRNREYVAKGFSGTGNLAVSAEVFQAVGDFAGIDRSEDRDWGLRATKLGYRVSYVPEMLVYHPTRPSYPELVQKLDREVAHQYAEVRGPVRHSRWFFRAMAMAVSPVIEVPRILSSDRISGWKQRALALACLVRVRTRRSFRMFALLVSSDRTADSRSWNRT